MLDWWKAQHLDSKPGARHGEFWHKRCGFLMRYERVRESMLDALTKAGITLLGFKPIPNRYSSGDEWGWPAWFKIETSFGTLLVGFRTRVYVLEWDPAGLLHPPDFAVEDVTKYEHGIHAWTFDDLVRYLVVIRECAKSPVSS